MAGGNSLERMISLLSAFSEDRPETTAEEMIAHFGYSRPTLYRYLKTLTDAGLIAKRPRGRYTLGPRVVEMDFYLRLTDPLIVAGAGAVRTLARRYKCTSLLVRWYRNRLLCVYSDSGSERPVTSYSRGRPMALNRGAIARSIIAFLPTRKARPLVEETMADNRELGLGDTPDEVMEALRRIRRRGYAQAEGEVTPGVVGTAAPIFDGAPSPIGALCLTIPAAAAGPELRLKIGREVKEAAQAITEELTGSSEEAGG